MKIGFIIASTRPERSADAIRGTVHELIANQGNEVGDLDLREINLPFLAEPKMPSQGDYQHESTKSWAAMVEKYDGFVVLSPTYNHSYPATIKNALDTLFAEWAGKSVATIAYGYSAPQNVIDHLQPVYANLQMKSVGGVTISLADTMSESGFNLTDDNKSQLKELVNSLGA